MAAPAPSQGPPSLNSGPSNPSGRWGRSGEPGSAFSGLSRGRGRGNGRGRGGKGGRGGGTPRDPKAGGDGRSEKPEAVQEKLSSSSTVKSSTGTALPASSSEKAASNNSSRPKPSSRRASRATPSVVTAQPTVSVEVSSPTTASRPQNRRRRSQMGKGPAVPLPGINVPAADDDLLRPNRPRVGPVPHSAPAKDTPPHLANSFDIRNNIDALVERVRAVAMADNRPSTPGSHIDWAGDDDDSLPDLDDWGVTTSTKPEMISPIIMEGLRPLPEPVINPLTPPLGKQTLSPSLPPSESRIEDGAIQPSAKPADVSTIQSSSTSSPTSTPSQQSVDTGKSLKVMPDSDRSSNTTINSNRLLSPNPSIPVQWNHNLPLHPSLPPKPVMAPTAHQRVRAAAAPIRHQPMTKSPPFKDIPAAKSAKAAIDSPEDPHNDTGSLGKAEKDTSSAAAETPKPEERDITPSSQELETEQELSAPVHTPSLQTPNEDNFFPDNKPREGLAASIHAPSALSESLSAPGDLSSFSSDSIGSRIIPLTHTRAHTVGRPPSFPRTAPVEHVPRFSRSGHSTPRGAYSGGYHARTHSTPPAGTTFNNNRTHATRPVITGDAISRLARTIGNTASIPSVKSTTVGASTD